MTPEGLSFLDRDPQGQADLLCGTWLIGNLVDRGWLRDDSGPFAVATDRVYASLALLAAEPEVSRPDREVAVREAIRLMGFRDGLQEEDYEIVTGLLAKAYDEMDWPGLPAGTSADPSRQGRTP